MGPTGGYSGSLRVRGLYYEGNCRLLWSSLQYCESVVKNAERRRLDALTSQPYWRILTDGRVQRVHIRSAPTALPQVIAYLFLSPLKGRRECLCFANSVYGTTLKGQEGADEEGMQLYRAVSQGELYDITLFDGFRPGPGCMETKLFAISAVDAAFFSREILYPLDNKPLTIVEVIIPHALGNRLFRFTTDGKPVAAVDLGKLSEFNALGRRQVLHSSPIP